jgi:Flp pilus assembly protein TadB
MRSRPVVAIQPATLCLQSHTKQYSQHRANFTSSGHKKEPRRSLPFNPALHGEGDIMLAFGILAAASGLALGLRYNVFTLLVLMLAILLILAVGALAGSSPLVFAIKTLVTLAAVQISYLFGSLLAAHFPARAKTLRRA